MGPIAALLTLLFAPRALEARQESLPGWFDLPVPGGAATLAALGIAEDERAVTLAILARALHDRDARVGLTQTRFMSLVPPFGATTSQGDTLTIPVPLDARTWRQLLPPPEERDLFVRLVSDRNSLILAAGLMATDDSVRALLARDRDLLRFIHQNAAGAFNVAARRLRIVDGRIVVPGGASGDTIWRTLSGETPTRAGPFLRALLTRDQGRLAWYYDTIGGLDSERLAAAWPGPDPLSPAVELYGAFRDSDPQWRLSDQPFRRSLFDAWTILTQVDVLAGAVRTPLPRESWNQLFTNSRLSVSQASRVLGGKTTPVTLSWLAHAIAMAPVRDRRPRFELFQLAGRVFRDTPPADRAAVVSTLSSLRESHAVLFTLERMRITAIGTWAAAVSAARHVASAEERRESLAAFQATLGLLERMRHVRAIDVDTADRLVRSLSDVVQTDRRVARAIAPWITGTLVPAVPPLVRPDAFTGRTAYESTLLQALAGRPGADQRPMQLEWEGLTYTVDLAAAEHDRLKAMRAILPSPGLDDAIANGPRDLADALTALLYATALGDPEGAAALSPDVVTRHDFGLTGPAILRDETPWSAPEERQGFGPWHVQGALMGLDLALSRLAMRRVADEQMPAAPTLTLNDLATLTRTVVVLVAAELGDVDRDELAAAIERGRGRVRDAGTNLAALSALAAEARASDTLRQLLPWMTSRLRETPPALFSLRDLLWLGRPTLTREQIDRWGIAADGLDGRRLTVMPVAAAWEDFAGRSEAGQVTTQVPDLTLRLVEETARLRLPAALVPSLLAFALDDYWHGVQARFADDWPQLTRQASLLSSKRIADYVAALTGSGPLRAQ